MSMEGKGVYTLESAEKPLIMLITGAVIIAISRFDTPRIKPTGPNDP